jgi:hypothetical protein
MEQFPSISIIAFNLMDGDSTLVLEKSQVKKGGLMTESPFMLTQALFNDSFLDHKYSIFLKT